MWSEIRFLPSSDWYVFQVVHHKTLQQTYLSKSPSNLNPLDRTYSGSFGLTKELKMDLGWSWEGSLPVHSDFSNCWITFQRGCVYYRRLTCQHGSPSWLHRCSRHLNKPLGMVGKRPSTSLYWLQAGMGEHSQTGNSHMHTHTSHTHTNGEKA